jgi:hypothetical protein
MVGATIAAVLAGPVQAAACTDNFNGKVNLDWNNTGNWSTGAVPTSTEFACVPSSITGQVVVSLNAQGVPAFDQVAGFDVEGSGGLLITGGASLEAMTTDSTIHNLTLESGFLRPDRSQGPSPLTLTLTGNNQWTGGSISVAFFEVPAPVDSRTIVAPGASLTVSQAGATPPQQGSNTLLINQGFLGWTSGEFCIAGDGIENASGATFTMNNNGGLLDDCTGLFSTPSGLTNDAGGVVNRTGQAGSDATINLTNGFTNNGTLKVSTLLTVGPAGSYKSSAGSTYAPVISGSGAGGTGFGQLQINGRTASTLAGAASPATAAGFHPTNGEKFQVVNCISVNCTSSFPSPGGGYLVQDNNPSDVILVATPQATPSPVPLNFGTVLLGTPVGLTETLANGGTAVLTVGTVGISGTNAGDFIVSSDACGRATVNPGASCAVKIIFVPGAAGSRTAILNFSDDAAGSPQKVALSGTGTTNPGSVSPPPSPSSTLTVSPTRAGSPSPNGSSTPSPKASPTASPSPTPSPTEKVTATVTPTPTTTVTLTVTPPPGATPNFVALSVDGRPFGPAGVGLDTTVQHYPAACTTAYFFFDGTRIGSASLDSTGHAQATGLSVPGNAKPGQHIVTSSCEASGAKVEHSAFFRVTPGQHRSAFVTSINDPSRISFTLHSVLLSAVLAGILLVLLAFPAQLFNATLQEHYEEVRRWFHLKRPLAEVVKDVNQRILFPIFLLVSGLLFALITPDFGFNRSTLALVLGLAIAVAVVTVGFAIPTFIYYLKEFRDRGQILVMPGSVIVGGVCVLISRLLHFEPGYLYGLLAIFVFHHETDERTDGRLAAVSVFFVIVLAIVAWVARVPLTGLAQKDPSFLALVLEAAVSGAFVIGLESILVGILPMRFLDGSRIKKWSTSAWLALFLLALFTLVEVLIQPGSGYVGHATTAGKFAVAALYIAFGLISLAFWSYFRFRKPRAEEELETEGDYSVR